jgi:hypothetical protein
MTEITGGDFDGFDLTGLSDLDADLFDDVDTDLPDPIDGADAPDLALESPQMTGGPLSDAGFDPELIVASDGTTFSGYSDFLSGADHPTPPS